jgi:hypothetical protein
VSDVGQLAERHAGDAGNARPESERHRIHPLAADAHRPRHGSVLCNSADVETEPRPPQHEQQEREDQHREAENIDAVQCDRQRLVDLQDATHPRRRRHGAVVRREERANELPAGRG